ncbi:MAG: NAD(P)/FAD-dependent oxidoreductase [Chitinophagaceae bacterium]|jgi:sulfide:quinone oxidoreductase|nr:NAD(P)/FAD-dependent oxidoreductase [Chitinophagaceae bacterium]
MKSHYEVLIIGGGTGGIMTAAQLKRKDSKLSIGLIEPSKEHFYQPAWTLVGAGAFNFNKTRRAEASLIPSGVDWIQDYATTFQPESNQVSTRNSGNITYDVMVISAGIQMDLDALPGLREALKTDSVCSNYLDPKKTFEVLKKFKGGNAVFTQPATPIRCGGAPQKIMYLAEEYFKKSGVRPQTNVVFATPGSVIFGVKVFADELNRILEEKHVHFKTFYKPVSIDPVKKEITFQYTKADSVIEASNLDQAIGEKTGEKNMVTMPYDMLHLAPPQSAPDFIKQSPFAYQDGPNKGWLNVDIHTLQSNTYANVFGLGDSAALPTAKTGAAIRKQVPVVVENVIRILQQMPVGKEKIYEGYSSCPIVTGYGKMLLCEFKYDNVRDSDPFLSKFVDTSKEKWSMWILKKFGLPWLYWNMMLKGRM